MKSLVPVLALAALAVTGCGSARFDYAPVTMVTAENKGGTYEDVMRFELGYDEQRRVVAQVTKARVNDQWKTAFLNSVAYDKDGRVESTQAQIAGEGQTFRDASRTTYEYEGTTIGSQTTYVRSGAEWVRSSRTVYTFDGKTGLPQSEKQLTWDPTAENNAGAWKDSSRTSWEYDADKRASSSETYVKVGDEFKKSRRAEYTWNDEGHLEQTITFAPSGDAWEKATRVTNTWEKGRLASTLEEKFVGGVFENVRRTTYEREPGKTATALVDEFKGGAWEKKQRMIVTFEHVANSDAFDPMNVWDPLGTGLTQLYFEP